MGKHGQPLLRQGLGVVTPAAFDGLERIQVVGHHPVQIEMQAGRNQVGDVARRLAAALDQDRLHVAGVSGIDPDRYAGDDFRVAAQQRHLSAFDQGIVILRDVADPVALVFVGVLPLAFLHVVLRPGERAGNLVALADGVPSAMIEVEMAIDDDVYVVRRYARRGQLVEQLSGLAVDLDHSFGQLVARAGFNQHGLRAGADDDGVQAQGNEIVALRLDLSFPETSGDNTEHASAIEVVDPVRDSGQLKIAEVDALHGNLALTKSLPLPV